MNYEQARRLIRELTDITVHPEKHDQTMWARSTSDEVLNAETPAELGACGTVGCLAGNAVINAGYKLRWENVGWSGHPEWIAHHVVDPQKADRRGRQISTVARELFGLDEGQAEVLFDQENRVSRMWAQAIEFSDGYINEQDLIRAYKERGDVLYRQGREDERAAIMAQLTKSTEV